MSDLRAAAQQALEALEFMADQWGFTNKANRPERWQAIAALRAALAQQEPAEPVAWLYYPKINPNDHHASSVRWAKTGFGLVETPLYTHPPRRREWQSLSMGEALTLWGMRSDGPSNGEIAGFARAIEQALKEKNQ